MIREDSMGIIFDVDAIIYGLPVEPVRFNIEGEISDNKSANYNSTEILGRSATIYGYTNSPSRSVSFTAMLICTYNPKVEVVDKANFLRSFVYPDYTTGAGFPRPPHRVHFSYGRNMEIIGIMQGCDITWDSLMSSGDYGDKGFIWEIDQLPMKASVAITINEVRESYPLDSEVVRTKGEGVWVGKW